MADAFNISARVNVEFPSTPETRALVEKFKKGIGSIDIPVNIGGKNVVGKIEAITGATQGAEKSTKRFGDAVGLAAKRFSAYTIGTAAIIQVSRALSVATREAIKFDTELNKIAQVIGRGVLPTQRELSGELLDISKKFGISASKIAQLTRTLKQAGFSLDDARKSAALLAKTDLLATFNSLTDTTEGLIAVMNQFKLSAEGGARALGSINAASNKYAVESADLIEAVRKTGGVFAAAGGNVEELIGLFTSVRSTTRETADTVATGFRTIFSRLQRPRTIEFFKKLNVELSEAGQFVGPYEAIARISQKLAERGIKPGSLQFAKVVEEIGGIRQASRIIPLLTEFAKAEKARAVATAGANSIDEDAEKGLKSLAVQIERVKANFTALIVELSQTSAFKEILAIVAGIANAFIETARAIRSVLPLLIAFGAARLGVVASRSFRAKVDPGLPPGNKYSEGGPIYASNGKFVSSGARSAMSRGTDTVDAVLTPGEFVVNASSAKKNRRLLQAINNDRFYASKGGTGYYASGGDVGDDFKRGTGTKILDPKKGQKFLDEFIDSLDGFGGDLKNVLNGQIEDIKSYQSRLKKTIKELESSGGDPETIAEIKTNLKRSENARGVQTQDAKGRAVISIAGGKATSQTVQHEASHAADLALGKKAGVKGRASQSEGTFQADLAKKIRPVLKAQLEAQGKSQKEIEYRLQSEEIFADAMANATPEVRKILVSTTDSAKGMARLAAAARKAAANGERLVGLGGIDDELRYKPAKRSVDPAQAKKNTELTIKRIRNQGAFDENTVRPVRVFGKKDPVRSSIAGGPVGPPKLGNLKFRHVPNPKRLDPDKTKDIIAKVRASQFANPAVNRNLRRPVGAPSGTSGFEDLDGPNGSGGSRGPVGGPSGGGPSGGKPGVGAGAVSSETSPGGIGRLGKAAGALIIAQQIGALGALTSAFEDTTKHFRDGIPEIGRIFEGLSELVPKLAGFALALSVSGVNLGSLVNNFKGLSGASGLARAGGPGIIHKLGSFLGGSFNKPLSEIGRRRIPINAAQRTPGILSKTRGLIGGAFAGLATSVKGLGPLMTKFGQVLKGGVLPGLIALGVTLVGGVIIDALHNLKQKAEDTAKAIEAGNSAQAGQRSRTEEQAKATANSQKTILSWTAGLAAVGAAILAISFPISSFAFIIGTVAFALAGLVGSFLFASDKLDEVGKRAIERAKLAADINDVENKNNKDIERSREQKTPQGRILSLTEAMIRSNDVIKRAATEERAGRGKGFKVAIVGENEKAPDNALFRTPGAPSGKKAYLLNSIAAKSEEERAKNLADLEKAIADRKVVVKERQSAALQSITQVAATTNKAETLEDALKLLDPKVSVIIKQLILEDAEFASDADNKFKTGKTEGAYRIESGKLILQEIGLLNDLNKELANFSGGLSRLERGFLAIDAVSSGKLSASSFKIDTDFSRQSQEEQGLNRQRLLTSGGRIGRQGLDNVQQGLRLEDLRSGLESLAVRLQEERAAGDLNVDRQKGEVSNFVEQRGGAESFGALSSAVLAYQEAISNSLDLGNPKESADAIVSAQKELNDKIKELLDPASQAFDRLNSSVDKYQDAIERLTSNTIKLDVSQQDIARQRLGIQDRILQGKNVSTDIRSSIFERNRAFQAKQLLNSAGISGGNEAKNDQELITFIRGQLVNNQSELQNFDAQNAQGVSLTKEEVVQRQGLIKQNAIFKASLERLSDTADQVSVEEEKLANQIKRRGVAENAADNFIFGSNENRRDTNRSLAATQFVSRGGSIESLPQELRASVGQFLKQFSGTDFKFAGGQTADELLKQIRKASGFNISELPEQQTALEIAGLKEVTLDGQEAMLEELRLQNRLQQQLIDQQSGNFQQFSKGGPVYANKGMFVPKGKDTIPAMLAPGEFVVNDKSAKENRGILESINGGTKYFGFGGIVDRLKENLIGRAKERDPEALQRLLDSEKAKADKDAREIKESTRKGLLVQRAGLDLDKRNTRAHQGRLPPPEISAKQSEEKLAALSAERQELETTGSLGGAIYSGFAQSKALKDISQSERFAKARMEDPQDMFDQAKESVRGIKTSTGTIAKNRFFNEPSGGVSGRRSGGGRSNYFSDISTDSGTIRNRFRSPSKGRAAPSFSGSFFGGGLKARREAEKSLASTNPIKAGEPFRGFSAEERGQRRDSARQASQDQINAALGGTADQRADARAVAKQGSQSQIAAAIGKSSNIAPSVSRDDIEASATARENAKTRTNELREESRQRLLQRVNARNQRREISPKYFPNQNENTDTVAQKKAEAEFREEMDTRRQILEDGEPRTDPGSTTPVKQPLSPGAQAKADFKNAPITATELEKPSPEWMRIRLQQTPKSGKFGETQTPKMMRHVAETPTTIRHTSALHGKMDDSTSRARAVGQSGMGDSNDELGKRLKTDLDKEGSNGNGRDLDLRKKIKTSNGDGSAAIRGDVLPNQSAQEGYKLLADFGTKFAESVDKLVGTEISLTLQPVNVNVNLNGADLLAKLPGLARSFVMDAITTEIARSKEKGDFGDVA